ncbi:phospholipid methyltransferase [Paenibacillus alba]|uniref:class I SAM-dependent methyltransferase n=1 Tax=Paenibacillus alba TaxID=1197127 RepID=UPI0015668F3B|nr:phospholipid methyltransferase [Paenibacillus alba]NQX67208.1 phospholipid methyltransferase [Paenibacillus alba]
MNSSQVGSVIPSSGFLTRTMLPVTLPWHKMKRIAELGPGTGAFTQHIQQNRSSGSRLYLYEKNETFRKQLARRFPELPLFDDALRLGEIVQETGHPFDLIVSGLPFANFSYELKEQLFGAIRDALADNGTFVAFQYTLLLKPHFQKHFPAMDTGYTWMNIPPAWVFKCKKALHVCHKRGDT